MIGDGLKLAGGIIVVLLAALLILATSGRWSEPQQDDLSYPKSRQARRHARRQRRKRERWIGTRKVLTSRGGDHPWNR